MASYKLVALLAAVLALTIVDYSKIYVTVNFERPTEFKIKAVFLKIASTLARIGSLLKISTEPIIFRNVLDFGSNIAGSFATKDETIILEDTEFDGLHVRIYTPSHLQNTNEPRPFMIFYHGGYYLFVNLDTYDQYLIQLSKKTNLVIISIDYRLAPENPFPGPFKDCIRATEYILQNTKQLKLDIKRYILAGDSAGGHATAGVTQHLARTKQQQPVLQVLIYPWTQMINFMYPSDIYYKDKGFMANSKIKIGRKMWWLMGLQDDISEEMEDLFVNNNHTLLIEDAALKRKYARYLDIELIPEEYKTGRDYYKGYSSRDFYHLIFPNKIDSSNILIRQAKLAGKLKSILSQENSPGLADDSLLKLLPKAYMIVFEWDTLKDQGLIYAQRLRQNGVPCEIAFYEDAYHGMIQFVDQVFGYNLSRKILDDLVNFINENI